MRLLMMGTGPFAVPTFARLVESPHEILSLITRPPRPLHGKSRAEANPMQQFAEERGLRIHAPEDVNAPDARAIVASYRPDLLVVCDYGQILSRDVLEIPRLGGINLHASLLPKYRGAAPINWAIYRGEVETGVTVIHMTPRLDAGPAIVQLSTPIGPDETAVELEPRLALLGAPAILSAIDALENDKAEPIEQDPAKATRARRLTKNDGLVDWSRTAAEIKNQVRALVPWPKTHTTWMRATGGPLGLILDCVQVAACDDAAAAGTIVEAQGERLVVATGQGALFIERIQPAGKRVMAGGEFLRGYHPQVGDHFGSPAT
jgi:methionyl-tRNA formyltransferase